MDDSASRDPEPLSPSTTLRRRNSVASTTVLVPQKLVLPATPHSISSGFLVHPKSASITPSTPSAALDLELVSLKSYFSSYTSLRDLIPSASPVSSPACASGTGILGSGCEISIRNRLVKQAAWAYLQPVCSPSPSTSDTHLFYRIWLKLLPGRCNPFTTCLSFLFHKLIPGINCVLDWILRTIRMLISR